MAPRAGWLVGSPVLGRVDALSLPGVGRRALRVRPGLSGVGRDGPPVLPGGQGRPLGCGSGLLPGRGGAVAGLGDRHLRGKGGRKTVGDHRSPGPGEGERLLPVPGAGCRGPVGGGRRGAGAVGHGSWAVGGAPVTAGWRAVCRPGARLGLWESDDASLGEAQTGYRPDR